jgi:hypothetical protein
MYKGHDSDSTNIKIFFVTLQLQVCGLFTDNFGKAGFMLHSHSTSKPTVMTYISSVKTKRKVPYFITKFVLLSKHSSYRL